MVRNKWKALRLLVLVICVITVSVIYKTKFTSDSVAVNASVPDYAKNRKIVELWVKENYYSDSILEQIENYNISNKDNIYINAVTYSADYVNMLRLKLLTSTRPDIFDIGTYDIMKKDNLYPLNNIGLSKDTLKSNRVLSYKNNIVGINVSGNVVKLVWNKDIFKKCGLNPDKAPATWEEVLKDASIIKSKMPGITPFEAPFSGFQEFKRSIGEPSVNSDTVYTTFWNYKKGEYDYSSSKYILDFYREMYKDNLMEKELETSDRDQVREDFYNQKSAMYISFYDDKVKFLSVNPIEFNMGISNLPKIKLTDSQNYYFIDDVKNIAINSISGDKPEVRKAFAWYASTVTDISKVATNQYKSKYFPEYNAYDNADNFRFEDKDPTPALGFAYKPIKDLIYSCIRGQGTTVDTINGLNKYLNDYCKDVKLKNKDFFNSFKSEE